MTSEVTYLGNLRTGCTHPASGTYIETDPPVDNHGKGERFSPTDLVATALPACMLSVMGIKAEQLGVNLEGVKVDVQKTMAAAPRRIAEIKLTYHVPEALQHLPPKTIVILKNTANTCPVKQSLHPDIKVDIDWGSWA